MCLAEDNLEKNKIVQAPFPYFGGKRKIASTIWQLLGQTSHYIEPFFGSGAVLLNRPDYDSTRHTETVNDKNGFISNVWRALKYAPDKTAEYADWPVNHADLMARKIYLHNQYNTLLDKLIEDESYYDPKIAGYWIWGASCSIGNMFDISNNKKSIPRLSATQGINQRSHIRSKGDGTHVIRDIPTLDKTTKGVMGLRSIHEWFQSLTKRLRYVRVVCGEWDRVCGGNWQDKMGNVGIFFDPPYSAPSRHPSLYHDDSMTVAHDVRQWCLERGDKPTYRIILAGYESEHQELLNHGWTALGWSANGGYANQGQKKNQNRFKETLFCSPHCYPINGYKQLKLL